MNGETESGRNSGKPTWELYFCAAALILGFYVLLGSTLRGFQATIMYKLLAFYLVKPFGAAASATNEFLPLNYSAELRSIFFNPVFYSGLFVGFKSIRKLSDLYRSAVPALIVLSPVVALTVIPNPIMLVGLTLLGAYLSLVIPYCLIGGLLGWAAFGLQSRISK